MASLVDRKVRAAKLDIHLYEEVEADPQAMGQAMTVVVISSVAAGLGNFGRGGLMGMIFGAVFALLGWYVMAYLIYFIGTRILPEPQTRADHGQLLRTMGFAASPGVLRVGGMLPFLGPLIFLAVSVWMLISTVIAVRQALDYRSTGRAVGVCLIGAAANVVISIVVASLFGFR